ncbi:hypothetical protein SLS56_000506 [Neofusicoccum ribis]|uniref:Uncharacterized protein n=1 Tax=Neofusicoccum ribis TaxID=45134 RepID=A0ABR3TF52_9PEZI
MNCNSTCWTNYNSGLEGAISIGRGYAEYLNAHQDNISNCEYLARTRPEAARNETVTIELDGKAFPYLSTVRYSTMPGIGTSKLDALCYAGRAYDRSDIDKNTRCLPDTDDASYRWGFSSTLTSAVLIVHALWVVSMYAVWLDAVRHSSLLREGYSLTQLRAVFALAAAARELTGLDVAELVRPAEGKEVEDRLNGDGAAAVDFAWFARGLLLPRAEGEARET